MTPTEMQQMSLQPVPSDPPVPPSPGPGALPEPIIDPTQTPPPIGDPDVVDPKPVPDAPVIA